MNNTILRGMVPSGLTLAVGSNPLNLKWLPASVRSASNFVKVVPTTPKGFTYFQQQRFVSYNIQNNTKRISLLSPKQSMIKNTPINQQFARFYSNKPGPKKMGLLSQSSSTISQAWLKLKWMLLRQNRPFNIDEVSAFVSWILMGNAIWIIIGTTTFAGLLIYVSNLLLGDDELSQNKVFRNILKKIITIDNNLNVQFDSENFRTLFEDGKIKFNNISIVSKENSNDLFHYDLKADSINITLSFSKYYSGKGLIQDVEIHGLKGVLSFNDDQDLEAEFVDRALFKDYEFGSFTIRDSKVQIYGVEKYNYVHNESFKLVNDSINSKRSNDSPINLAIFNCELERLRSDWLIYDFLNSNSCAGTINDSLFTLHKRQNQVAYFSGLDPMENNSQDPWEKATTLRIDQIELPYTDPSCKFNWIKSCKVDIVADIMFPTDDKETFAENWKEIFHNSLEKLYKESSDDHELTISPSKYIIIDVKVGFQELKAAMPSILPHSTLHGKPYISEDDMRSLVNFINDKKYGLSNYSPIEIDENPFDGSELDGLSHEGNNSNINNTVGGNPSPLPPVKFRVIQKLEDCKLVDICTLLSFNNTLVPKSISEAGDAIHQTSRESITFVNTNKLMDSVVSELLSCLMSYKEELQLRLIDTYSKRTNFEIFFNNFVIGNLILVGLGAFII